MIPLVGNIFTICTNSITIGTIGKEIGANDKNGNANGTTGRTLNKRMDKSLNQIHVQIVI